MAGDTEKYINNQYTLFFFTADQNDQSQKENLETEQKTCG